MSLSSIMSSASSGLKAAQAQIQWRSDNINNANSATYVRRDATSVSTSSHNVSVTVKRASDAALQKQVQDATSASSAATVTSDYFTQLGDVFGTTQSTSYLQEKMDSFNAAWQNYESDSSSSTSEALVISSAQSLTGTITDTAQQLQDLGTQASKSAGEMVDDLNTKLQSLAKLNQQLKSTNDVENTSPELLDQRDSLLSDLSETVGINVVTHDDGSVAVYTKGGAVLVDNTAQQFTWNTPSGGQAYLSVSGSTSTTAPGLNNSFSGGKLGATLDFLNPDTSSSDPNVGTLAKAQAQLDAFASQLADSTTSGSFGAAYDAASSDRTTDLAGSFFTIDTSSGLSASQSLAVNSSLIDGTATVKRLSATSVVATLTDTSHSLSAGGLTSNNKTYSGLAAAIAGYHSTAAAQASASETQLSTTTSTLQTRYSSQTGVNMDEELAQLTVLQNSYAASAKVITTVQSMYDTLLNLSS